MSRLRKSVHVTLNLEMAARRRWSPSPGVKPEMATLVPEAAGTHHRRRPRHRRAGRAGSRKDIVAEPMAAGGIRTSVFIDAELPQVEAAARIGASVCEIHTGPYAHAFHAKGRDPQIAEVVRSSAKSVPRVSRSARGDAFQAGHALNYFNVQPVAALPGVRELHIGHAIVSRSVFVGMREAVRQMKALIREAGPPRRAALP